MNNKQYIELNVNGMPEGRDLSCSLELLHERAIFLQLYCEQEIAPINGMWIAVLNDLCQSLSEQIRELGLQNIDPVISYTSVLMQFSEFKSSDLTQVDTAAKLLPKLSHHLQQQSFIISSSAHQQVLELEVIYGGAFGPDLSEVAELCKLTEQEVINKHSQQSYQVFALGFSPGFAFLGETDKAIQLPRRSSTKLVKAGGVAIAENQTAIYPDDSPGGWHIIGHCSAALFDLTKTPATLLMPGQRVRFKPLSVDEKLLPIKEVNEGDIAPQPPEHIQRIARCAAFKVIKSQGISQFVDLGRLSASRYGLTPAGPMDEYAYYWANGLLANDVNALTIEITMAGLQLKSLSDAVIAISGADLQAVLIRAGEQKPLQSWLSYRIQTDDKIIFKGFCQKGLRAYLAIQGGFQCDYPGVYGSFNSVTREALGGEDNKGRLLINTDVLYSCENLKPSRLLQALPFEKRVYSDNTNELTLTIRLCYQAELMPTEVIKQFLSQSYCLSARIDRMAYRLVPERALALNWSKPLSSEGIALGSIQITPEGEPIIMMRDRQTIGGYPKIAVLQLNSVNLLAQAVPGQYIRFTLEP